MTGTIIHRPNRQKILCGKINQGMVSPRKVIKIYNQEGVELSFHDGQICLEGKSQTINGLEFSVKAL